MLDFSFFSQQKDGNNGNGLSLKINSIQIRHTERMKSNKIEYYICDNIINFTAKFQKVVFKTKVFMNHCRSQNML